MKNKFLAFAALMICGIASAQVNPNTTTDKTIVDEPKRDTLQVDTQLKKETDLKKMDAVKTQDHVKTSKAPAVDKDIKSSETTTKTKKEVRRKTQNTTTK